MRRAGKAWGLESPKSAREAVTCPRPPGSEVVAQGLNPGSSKSRARDLQHSAVLSPGTDSHPSWPDFSYNCSLLFQGDFSDCSGPIMLVIPSFLQPSYPAEPRSLLRPVSFFSPSWLESVVAFEPPGQSWQGLAPLEQVLG